MKVIDLLNKIANKDEVPKAIKKQWKYKWQYDEVREEYTYMQETGERFDNDWLVINMLNDEIEIIEEEKKIPEKLEDYYLDKKGEYPIELTMYEQILRNKINDIIDYLKSKGE